LLLHNANIHEISIYQIFLCINFCIFSENNDERGEKFELFRDIPTFREYLLIDSRRVWAELWRKSNEGIWSLVFERKSLESSLFLETIGMELPLSDLYVNTEDLPETVFEIR